MDAAPEVQETGNLSATIYEWLQSLVVAWVVCLLIFVFGVRQIGVDGRSMVPTLHHQDRIIVSNVLYEPERGDVVVLTNKEFMTKPIVKRVIAVGGDTVDIDYDAGYVILNGSPIDEPYINERMLPRLSGVDFPLTVPEDFILVMGDNRNNSSDGRVFGPVDKREVLGRVYVVAWPVSNWKVVT